jgi:DNA polymerase eta
MQWDAALAVNYPAREFGIKRGDTFQIIHEKSGGKCISLHLPVKSYDDVVESDRVDEESSLLHNSKEGLQNHPNAVPSDCHPHEHDTESFVPTAAAHDEAILNNSSPILPEEEEEDKFESIKPENQPDLADITETFDGESSLDDSFKREYCLSRERQLELFEKEKNAMKEMNVFRNHGKASLDR